MVITRYGTAVQIQSRISEEGWVWVQREDGTVREYHLSDLKADGGLKEIHEAAEQFDAAPEGE